MTDEEATARTTYTYEGYGDPEGRLFSFKATGEPVCSACSFDPPLPGWAWCETCLVGNAEEVPC